MNLQNKTNFNKLLTLITTSKQKVLKQVNSILIELYWNIGKYLSTKTIQENWGKSVVEELAGFIQKEEPTIKGFTSRNIWRMKQFFETYIKNEKLTRLVTQISWTNNLLILSASKSDTEREFYLNLSIDEMIIRD